jgi:LmbE family N-acetylglucosaminyl deacetylase
MLSSGKYVFLFAHPDDDVFIAGAMRLLLERGTELHCVWVTSGDYFGKGEQREKELAQAMSVLGLHEPCVHLLRFPDLGLLSRLDEAADSFAALLDRIRPDVIVANAFEGGHPDHDCVNFLAYEGPTRLGIAPRLFEFPLYNGSGPSYQWRWKINRFPNSSPPEQHTVLTDTAVACKHQMMKEYAASQWMYMVPARLASPRRKLMTKGELYRACPSDRDHTLPPHSGKLNYERWFNSFMRTTFEDYRRAVLKTREKSR